ncbi:MAG: hypothetical protein ABIN20_03810 [candidate division WOR-3 bacterium]
MSDKCINCRKEYKKHKKERFIEMGDFLICEDCFLLLIGKPAFEETHPEKFKDEILKKIKKKEV